MSELLLGCYGESEDGIIWFNSSIPRPHPWSRNKEKDSLIYIDVTINGYVSLYEIYVIYML